MSLICVIFTHLACRYLLIDFKRTKISLFILRNKPLLPSYMCEWSNAYSIYQVMYHFCLAGNGVANAFFFAPVHDDVIKWNTIPRHWPFVLETHRLPVNSPHKCQWRGALMFFICARINSCINNCEAVDLRRHRAHYDVNVMHKYLSEQKSFLTRVTGSIKSMG